MTTELMYDCTPPGVNAIPANAKAVAGYIDGMFQSYPLLLHRFGGKARVVSIGVNIGNLAEWSDVEPGNAIITPAEVRADWEHKRAHGIMAPGFYADQTRMESVVLPGLSGIARSEFKLWLADWDGNENFIPLPGGVEAAKQFKDEGLFDVSVINPAAFFGEQNRRHHATNVGAGNKTVTPHDKEENAEFHKWWNQGFRKGYVVGESTENASTLKSLLSRAAELHPKVAAAGGGGGLGIALTSLLSNNGVHLSSTEGAAISTISAALAGWLTKVKP